MVPRAGLSKAEHGGPYGLAFVFEATCVGPRAREAEEYGGAAVRGPGALESCLPWLRLRWLPCIALAWPGLSLSLACHCQEQSQQFPHVRQDGGALHTAVALAVDNDKPS